MCPAARRPGRPNSNGGRDTGECTLWLHCSIALTTRLRYMRVMCFCSRSPVTSLVLEARHLHDLQLHSCHVWTLWSWCFDIRAVRVQQNSYPTRTRNFTSVPIPVPNPVGTGTDTERVIRNVVKRGICYQRVCPSVSVSVSHTRETVQNIKTLSALYDRGIFLVSCGQIYQSRI